MTYYRITVHPPGGRVWGSNTDHRAHHHEVARHRAAVREHAGWLAKAARIPAMRHARVAITIHLRGYKHADATNYPSGATVKAALDGLVDAGVAPSDRPEHLDVVMPALKPLEGDGPRVVLEITGDQDGEAP